MTPQASQPSNRRSEALLMERSAEPPSMASETGSEPTAAVAAT